MPPRKNPFTPSFGVAPLFLAGRDTLVDDLLGALDNWPGDPSLSTIVVGARGTGKTSLLTVVSQGALQRGWVSADVSATEGMLEDVIERAADAADAFVAREPQARIKAVNIGQLFGLEWEYRKPKTGNWRTRMNRLLDTLAEHDIGLLITVDEVRADLDEMIHLATVYQHFVRENRKVALLMAGLPDKTAQLIDNESVSFLRRASRRYLGRIGTAEVKIAARRTIEASERSIADDALDEFVRSVDGFPYMMQLVGFRAWAQNPQTEELSVDDVLCGASLAHEDMERQILAPTWATLSKGDRLFLQALSDVGGKATLAEVSAQLGKPSNYTTKNRVRLLEKGVIETLEDGELAFAFPGMAEYVASRS